MIGNIFIGGVHSTSAEWFVSTNILSTQAKWDGFTTEPPLSIRRACEIALAPVREKIPTVRKWLVAKTDLRNLFDGSGPNTFSFPNVWCYQITFTPTDLNERAKMEEDGLQYAATQIVLLDGTVVPPIVTIR